MAENTSNNTQNNNTNGGKNVLENIGKATGLILKHPIIAIVIIVTIVIIILSVSDYDTKKNVTKENPDDPKNAPAAANGFINNVYLDEEGKLRTEKSINELWKELKEKGNAITKYLNSPQELAKLLSAAMATDYPDTRPYPDIENPINWNDLDLKVDSTEVQGIVKFKRALASNEKITMTYLPPAKFQEKISKYNSTGKAEDRDEALKYFTIERSMDISNPNSIVDVGTRAFNNNVLNFVDNIDIYRISGNLFGRAYDAVQGCCYDGKNIICSANKGKHGSVGGRVFWINANTKKLEPGYVDVGSEGGHMEGITYDSDNKWVLVGVDGSKLLRIDNLSKSNKGYVKIPKHFTHYAYSVTTHELLGYRGNKITFMKYNSTKDEYEEQRTVSLNNAKVTHIQGISCDGQVIFLSDSRPKSEMSRSNYRLWAFDFQGNKVEEHKMGTGYRRGTNECENSYVDKEGNLWIMLPHEVAKAQGYKAHPVDWENNTSPTPSSSENGTSTGSFAEVEEILKYACSWIGKIDYELGADGKLVNGGKSDCSHYVHRVYEHFGLMNKFVHSLDWGKGGDNGGCPGTENRGTDMSKASPGDVIWEHYGSGSHNHVYIYMGKDKNGKYKKVQCANTNHAQGVYISNVNTKEVDAILHFKDLPTDPNAYFDPDTGILHTSSGNSTSTGASSSSTATTSTTATTTTNNSTSTSNSSSTNTNQVADILKYACSWEGKIGYKSGASEELRQGGKTDCGFFVYHVYKRFGLMSHHVDPRKWVNGAPGTEEVGNDLSKASPGDVIWRRGSNGRCHVSIYLGNKRRVHSTPGHRIKYSKCFK